QRRGGLDREAIDVLLECLDALASAVEAIDVDGEEKLDEAPLIERLKGLVREDRDGDGPSAAGPPTAADIAVLAGGRRVLHAVAELASDVMMPSVRAYMALAALAEHGEVLASVPPEEGIDAFDGRTIEAWIASEHEEGAVHRTLAEIADIAAASVTEQPPSAGASAEDEDAALQPELAAHGSPRKTSSTVRVDAERLDQLMHLMGELVVHRTAVESLAAGVGVPGLSEAMQDLTRS